MSLLFGARKGARTVAAFSLAALVGLAGCGSGAGKVSQPVPAAKDPQFKVAPAAQLQKFYDQQVVWESCAGVEAVSEITEGATDAPKYSCATIAVPLDYANPAGETISLQLVRHSNDGEVKTPLLYNPGGPGGSAVAGLPNMVEHTFTNDVQAKYDLVAVDPRGVGTSTPVQCLTAEETDNVRAGLSIAGEELPESADDDFSAVVAEAEKYSAKCLQNSPGIAAHADTNSVVADFDVVRAALGQEKLHYFGFSYGTYIGALYADTFPQRVGRMVLDGAVDPALNVDEIADGQAEGFENVIKHFLEVSAAADADFPFRGADAGAMLVKWWKQVDEQPLRTADSDRPLTGTLLRSAILGGLYSEDYYQFVAAAIKIAYSDADGSELLNLADLISERRTDGSYKDNSADAFNVVNALDYLPVGGPVEWQAHADKLEATYPIVGEMFGGASAGLAGWKIKSKDTKRVVSAEGAAPILVVGTTHDPATPYQWSVELAKQLRSARLISQEGWGHGAYGQDAGDCLRLTVDKYLLGGQVPTQDLHCDAD